jgi:hypothetical protein
MKQIRKGSLQLEGFKSFAAFASEHMDPLNAPEQFVRRITEEIQKAAGKETLVYGLRTESMFAAMVAGLGAVNLLKADQLFRHGRRAGSTGLQGGAGGRQTGAD